MLSNSETQQYDSGSEDEVENVDTDTDNEEVTVPEEVPNKAQDMHSVCEQIQLRGKSEYFKPSYSALYSSSLCLLKQPDQETSSSSNSTLLTSILQSHHLKLEKRSLNDSSNNFLNATIYALNQLHQKLLLNDNVIQYLHSFSLTVPISLEIGVITLKRIIRNEILNRQDIYIIFLSSENVIDKLSDNSIELDDDKLGTVLPLALCNALRIPVVVMTGMAFVPVIPLISNRRILSPHPIYLAFDHSTGTYESLHIDDIPCASINVNDVVGGTIKEEIKSCRCGQGTKKKLSGIESCKVYKSGCPCFKSINGCTVSCKCIGCKNPYGQQKNEDVITTISKKRRKHEMSSKLPESASFYTKREKKIPIDNQWTTLEEIFLIELMKFFAVKNIDDPVMVYDCYLSVYSSNVIDCSYKTMPQVLTKMNRLYKSDQVFQKLMQEQVHLSF